MMIVEIGSDFRSDENHRECNRKKTSGNASRPGYKGLEGRGSEHSLPALPSRVPLPSPPALQPSP